MGGELIVWQSNIYLNVFLIFTLFFLAISLYIIKKFRGTKNFYARLFLFFMIVWMAAEYLERAKDEYYLFRGWDRETSLQTMDKLTELDLVDVAEVLRMDGALAASDGQ